MRKILKTDKEAKGIRTPITFDTDKRWVSYNDRKPHQNHWFSDLKGG